MKPVRFATIGTSPISRDFIDVLCKNPRGVYVGTLSRNAQRGEAFVRELGGKACFGSVQEVAAATNVDAVYVASPNALHTGQALELVRAGKHVLIEKPLASTAAEAADIFDAARAAGVVAMEAIRPVHDPGLVAIKELLPRLGQVRRATLRNGSYSSRYDVLQSDQHTNIFDVRMATGALMDMGVYPVEVMAALFGAPTRVQAMSVMLPETLQELTGGPLDGAGSILAHYGTHIVEVAYSKICTDCLPSQIEGELGSLSIDNLEAPEKLQLHLRGKAIRSSAANTRSQDDYDEIIELEPCDNNMCYELNAFLACVEAAVGASSAGAGADATFGGAGAGGAEGQVAVYQQITLDSLAVMDEARRQCGIVFAADKQ